MPNNSPNMNLPIPVIGVDSGLQWEQAVQAALNILDGHTHATNSGVQIQPTGINISSDLQFNSQNAIGLRTVRLTQLSATPSDPTDLGCLYVGGVGDLYFIDESGNNVQITSGGGVNATSSGISSGNALASFVGGVLVVYSDYTNTTAGDISVGSVLLGLNTSSAFRLTLSPPASLSGGSYSLVLPAIPATPKFVTIDTSGNLGTAGSISGAQLATATITGPQIAAATISGTNIAATTIRDSNLQVLKPTFSSVVSFSTNSASYVVSGLQGSITTFGGSVQVGFTGNGLRYSTGGTTNFVDSVVFGIFRDGILISEQVLAITVNAIQVPAGSLNFVDFAPAAGAHTYVLKMKTTNGTGGSIAGSIVNVLMTLTEI